jgi:hypothetical protein
LEVCDIEMNDTKSLTEKINIEAIGKKLKEIDDMPH